MEHVVVDVCHRWVMVLALQSVYAAALAALLFGLLRAVRVTSPLVREAAGWLVFARLVIPPGWAMPWSLPSIFRSAADRFFGETSQLHQVGPWDAVSGAVVGGAVPVDHVAVLQWPVVLCVIWLIGVAVLVSLWLGRVARYRGRMVATDVPVDPRLVALVDHWRHALGVRRAIRVVVTSQLPMPCTTGVLRPVIHLPEAVVRWADHEVEPVIAHEVAHVARLDAVRIVVINLLRAVFFFHPLVWLVARHVAVVRERDCDERVLASGRVSPRDYGHALLAVLRLMMFGGMHAHATLGLLDRKDGVEMRLSRISKGSYRRRPRPSVVAAGFVLAGFLALPMAATGGSHPVESVASAPHDPALTTEIRDGIAVYRFIVDGPITEPLKLEGPHPEYPESARDARIQGAVVMRVIILADGSVRDVEVIRGLPLGLTKAAVAAVRQWRFQPAILDGRPVAVSYFLTVRFNLQDDDEQPPMMPPVPMPGEGAAPAVSFHLGEAGDDTRGAIDRLRGPVLDEVMRALPQGVTVTDISLSGSTVVVRGTCEEAGMLGDLLTRLDGTLLTLEPGSIRGWEGPDDQLMFVFSGSIVDH